MTIDTLVDRHNTAVDLAAWLTREILPGIERDRAFGYTIGDYDQEALYDILAQIADDLAGDEFAI